MQRQAGAPYLPHAVSWTHPLLAPCMQQQADPQLYLLPAALSGGGGYNFDVEQGPKAVFNRFFGTANPYEALNSALGAGSVLGLAAQHIST